MSESDRGRVALASLMDAREYFRNPVNVALLVTIPYLFVYFYGAIVEHVVQNLPEEYAEFISVPEAYAMGAFFGAAVLTGLVGFYMVTGARAADRRLVVAGYRPLQVVAGRILTILVVALALNGITMLILSFFEQPRFPLAVLAATLVGSTIYGFIGVVVGSFMEEFEGSITLFWIITLDVGISFQLGETGSAAGNLFPGYHPNQVMVKGVTEGTFAAESFLLSLVYALCALAVAVAVFHREAST
ncbi:MAG: hypothetical protein MAG715_00332 [Methanonatronarchaeales archaeon]|nr:hypothetical protein [Methanonatronarchaeales archaeon]